ncbi:MAG: fused MFS/spermidine synthase [Nitrospinae bacterium]|nr:fused MFS/spermidine synthase [Nitrospinota bacterium]
MNPRLLILPIFFLSGFTGLLYEIVWTRQLALLFGVSSLAVSTVLTVFMGGLGLGSLLAGKAIDKRKSPLLIYAALELGIGVYALFLPYGISLLTPFYLFFHPFLGDNFTLISLVRFLFSTLLLLVPCSLMGATFPVISRFFVRGEDSIGKDAGVLYSLNTLGAVCGCLFTGFYLVENLGISGSIHLAAGLNLALAMASFALSWLAPEQARLTEQSAGKKEAERKEAQGKADIRPVLFFFGLSGFTALALEVLWTRIFIILIDNTVYAFTTILFSFLAGIAAGSFCLSRMDLKKNRLVSTFGKMQAGIGLCGLWTLVLFLAHNEAAGFWNAASFKILGGAGGEFWAGKIFASFLFIFSLLIVPTFLMGGTFPVVFRICSPAFSSAGRSLGLIYSVNTAGAILGSFCAGFVLLPMLGTQKAVILLSTLSCLSGIYLLGMSKGASRYSLKALTGVGVPYIISAAFLFYQGDIPKRISQQKLDLGNETLFFQEGATGTVLVSSQENDLTPFRKPIKRIWINGDPIAGTFREALQLEWLQAHLPLLLHPDPQETVVICFGTGATAGAIAQHPVKEILAVDTSNGVFQAARYFTEGNSGVSNDPRFKALVEDGRQFLAATSRKFDFITSEPPPPSNAGIVNLYSREYYEICKSRLKPGGMVSQWIPLHHLAPEDFRSLVAAFVSVFPRSSMWYTKWDAVMVGLDREISIDYPLLKRRMEEGKVRKSLEEIGFDDPGRLLASFMMGEEGLARYVQGARVVTDDRPTVEFTAPRIHHIGTKIKGENLRGLLKYREPVLPLVKNVAEEERAGFEEKLAVAAASQLRFYEGRLEENDDKLGNAVARFKEALAMGPSFSDARLAFLKIHIGLAYHFLKEGKASAGLKVVGECMEADAGGAFRPQLFNVKGLLHLSLREFQAAAREFHEALALDKNFPGPYMNLGALYAEYLNDPEKAAGYYRQCLGLKITEREIRVVEEELKKLSVF